MSPDPPDGCVVCGNPVPPSKSGRRALTCSPECRTERNRQTSHEWYWNNREHHLETVKTYGERPEIRERRNSMFKARKEADPRVRERYNGYSRASRARRKEGATSSKGGLQSPAAVRR